MMRLLVMFDLPMISKAQKKEYGSKVIIAGGLYMLFGKQVIYLFVASLKPFMRYNSQYLYSELENSGYSVSNKITDLFSLA